MKWMKLVSVMNEIEVNLSHEKLNFINDTYQKELQYWKKSVLTKNERKELRDLAPARVFLPCKAAAVNAKNIDEIVFYLKSQYLTYNEEQRTFI